MLISELVAGLERIKGQCGDIEFVEHRDSIPYPTVLNDLDYAAFEATKRCKSIGMFRVFDNATQRMEIFILPILE